MTSLVAEARFTHELTHHICTEASCWPWWGAFGSTYASDPVRWIEEHEEHDGPDRPKPICHEIEWDRGLELMLTGTYDLNLKLFDVNDGGYADDADKFLQLCVFGEIRYG